MTALLWVLAATLSTSFLCSVLEAVFLSISHSYVALLQERGEWAGEWLSSAMKKLDEPIAAILTLNTIAHTIGATMGGAMALQIFGSAWVAAFSAVLTLAILVLTEIVPKTLGATYWKQLAIPTAHILRVMTVGMKPIIVPLGWISGLLTSRTEGPTVSRAELEVLAEIGLREGALDEDEWKVMSNVIRLDEVSIGEVMTPRTDIIAVPVDASLREAMDLMLAEGHLRLPVYSESLDTIEGVVLARDVWRADREGVVRVRDIVRPVPFAPASKPVEDLIPEMRSKRTKLAIVVDEFGGTAGLVTLEDLIEEIIGEIQDEHEDDEPEDFHPMPGGRYRIWGGAPLREASARLNFTLTESEQEGFDTLGGFVFGKVNRIPVVGDQVEVGSGTLRVVRMRGRRIEYLVFQPADRGRE